MATPINNIHLIKGKQVIMQKKLVLARYNQLMIFLKSGNLYSRDRKKANWFWRPLSLTNFLEIEWIQTRPKLRRCHLNT
jgi:hypothetical protein